MENRVNEKETEWVDLVDEENNVMVKASSEQIRSQPMRHRSTFIVIHDGMGKVLVQRRTKNRKIYPGLLDATVGGMVHSGEVMLDAARRRAQEKLGIVDVPLAEHGTFYFEREECGVWGGLFSCVSHGPFAIQQEKVQEISWMLPEEITAQCSDFTPDSLQALLLWVTRYNSEQLEGE